MFLLSISLRGVIIIASQQWGYLGVQSFHGNGWILWDMTIYRYRILGTVSASAPYRIINGTKTKSRLSLVHPKLIDRFQRSFSLDHMISQCSIQSVNCIVEESCLQHREADPIPTREVAIYRTVASSSDPSKERVFWHVTHKAVHITTIHWIITAFKSL